MTHDEMIEVIAAHRDGKQIECLQISGDWRVTHSPLFNFSDYTYRIKPAPIEGWVNQYDGWFGDVHSTPEAAILFSGPDALRTAVHLREVR